MKIGIIGATGWLGSALGRRLLSQGLAAPGDLVALNRSGPRPGWFGPEEVIWAQDPADLVAQSDVIVLSVRPEDWPALALRAPGKLVVSFMAGVGIEALKISGARIVRSMPNASSEIGRSYTPWFAAPEVTAQDRAVVRRLLSAIGTEDELGAESQVDLMGTVPGSGAAYPALMAVALHDFLVAKGVADSIAWRAAESVVVDGAGLMAGRIGSAPAMLAAYRDYRGITAAGLDAAEAAGFGRSLHAALDAAVAKSAQMGAPAKDRI